MDKILLVGTPRSGTTYIKYLVQEATGLEPWSAGVHSEPYRPIIRQYEQDKKVDNFRKNFLKTATDIRKHGILVKDQILHYKNYNDITNRKFPFDVIYKDFYKVRIIRDDFKNLVLSLCVAKETNQWHKWKGQTSNIDTVRISRKVFDSCIKIQKTYQRAIYETTIQFDQTIYYEDLTSNPSQDIKLLKPFKNSIVNSVKVEKNALAEEVISNIEEVNKWLKNSL